MSFGCVGQGHFFVGLSDVVETDRRIKVIVHSFHLFRFYTALAYMD